MYCIIHNNKRIKFVLQYLHGPGNRSSINMTTACSLECLRAQLDPENKEESMVTCIEEVMNTLG